MSNKNLTVVEEGKICLPLKDAVIEDLTWQPHASFRGVQMKHLIRAENTDGQFSIHLVRVESDFALEEHTHTGRWELHEVLSGKGRARVGEKDMDYSPMTFAVIPADTAHRVEAEETLYLLAKFVPALL